MFDWLNFALYHYHCDLLNNMTQTLNHGLVSLSHWYAEEQETCVKAVRPTHLQRHLEAANIDKSHWEISPTPCWIYSKKNQGGSEGLGTVGPSLNLCSPKEAIIFIIVRFKVIKIGMWGPSGVTSPWLLMEPFLSFCQHSQSTVLAFWCMWISAALPPFEITKNKRPYCRQTWHNFRKCFQIASNTLQMNIHQ